MPPAVPLADIFARIRDTVTAGPRPPLRRGPVADTNIDGVLAEVRAAALKDHSAETERAVGVEPAPSLDEDDAMRRLEKLIRRVFDENAGLTGPEGPGRVAELIWSGAGLPDHWSRLESYGVNEKLLASVSPAALCHVLFDSNGMLTAATASLLAISPGNPLMFTAAPLMFTAAAQILMRLEGANLLYTILEPGLTIDARLLASGAAFLKGLGQGLEDSGIGIDTLETFMRKHDEAFRAVPTAVPLLMLLGHNIGVADALKDEFFNMLNVPANIEGFVGMAGAAHSVLFTDKGHELAEELGAMLAGEFLTPLKLLVQEEYVVKFLYDLFHLQGYFFTQILLMIFDPLKYLGLAAKFGAMARRAAVLLAAAIPSGASDKAMEALGAAVDLYLKRRQKRTGKDRRQNDRNDSGGGGDKTPDPLEGWEKLLGTELTAPRRKMLAALGDKSRDRLKRYIERSSASRKSKATTKAAEWLDKLTALQAKHGAQYEGILRGIERYEELIHDLGGGALPLGRSASMKSGQRPLFHWYELLDLPDQQNVANVLDLFNQVLPHADRKSAAVLAGELFHCMDEVVEKPDVELGTTFDLPDRRLWRNWRGLHGSLEAAAAYLKQNKDSFITFEVPEDVDLHVEFDADNPMVAAERRRPDFTAKRRDNEDALVSVPYEDTPSSVGETLAEVKNFDPAYPDRAKGLVAMDSFRRQRSKDVFLVLEKLGGDFARWKLYFPQALLDQNLSSGGSFRAYLSDQLIKGFDADIAGGGVIRAWAVQNGLDPDIDLGPIRAAFIAAIDDTGPDGIIQGF
jgi:hypothetical protein